MFPPQWEAGRVYAPKFPKPRNEGWFLVLGNAGGDEVLALRRTPGVRGRRGVNLNIRTPDTLGEMCFFFLVYFEEKKVENMEFFQGFLCEIYIFFKLRILNVCSLPF